MKRFFSSIKHGCKIHLHGRGGPLIAASLVATIALCLRANNLETADFYLAFLSIVANLIILYSTGAWKNRKNYLNDLLHPTFSLALLLSHVITLLWSLCFLFFGQVFSITLLRICWYIDSVANISTAIFFTLKSADRKNPKWLDGTNGRIGPANRISAFRISIASLLPHIYLANTFGEYSHFVACTILTIAVATDKLDGTIARRTHSITRAGMALDPIGDKVLFYPVAFAFAVIGYRTTDYSSSTAPLFIATVASAVIIIARDAIILAWFAIYGRHTHNISATLADKIRMVILCTWLLSTAYRLGFAGTIFGTVMGKISVVSLLSCAAFSVFSVISDFHTTQIKDKF